MFVNNDLQQYHYKFSHHIYNLDYISAHPAHLQPNHHIFYLVTPFYISMTYITNRNILFQKPFPFNITVQYLKYVLYSVHIYLTRNLETVFKFFGIPFRNYTNVLNSHLDLTILALVFTVLLIPSPYQSFTLLPTNTVPLSLPILYPSPYQSSTLLLTNPLPFSLPILYPSTYKSSTLIPTNPLPSHFSLTTIYCMYIPILIFNSTSSNCN